MNEIWKYIVDAAQPIHSVSSSENVNAMEGFPKEQPNVGSPSEESKKKRISSSKSRSGKKAAPGPLILPPPMTVAKQIKKAPTPKESLEDSDKELLVPEGQSSPDIVEEMIDSDTGKFPEGLLQGESKEVDDRTDQEAPDSLKEDVQENDDEQGMEVQAEENQDTLSDELQERLPEEEEENVFLKNAGKYQSSESTSKNKEVRKLIDYNTWIEEFLLENEMEEDLCVEKYAEESKSNNVEDNEMEESWNSIEWSLVSLPVILSKTDMELEIFDSYHLPASISSIVNSEWSIHSVEARVPLPSNIAFFKGMLLLTLDYTCDKQKLHSVKVQVPWIQTVEVHWIKNPDLSLSYKKEYMFRTSDCEEPTIHYEDYTEYAKSIHFDLSEVNFVWHEELDKQVNKSKIAIKGTGRFSINLIQEQYVKIT